MNLEQLLHQPGIWRGRAPAPRRTATLAIGWPELDRLLPSGWPQGAISEILTNAEGVGELTLVLPALHALVSAGRRIAVVAPPHIPYPVAWHQQGLALEQLVHVDCGPDDVLWASEQLLRSSTCGAVLCWPPQATDRQLRRLQLAAERGRCHGFTFRPLRCMDQASPAAMRVAVEARDRVRVLKRRGQFVSGIEVSLEST